MSLALRLVGRSPAITLLRERAAQLADRPIPLLILGETGSGKEVFAEAVVELGGWKPFVRVNCAALPEPLVEAELFGYERGAFSGAVRPHSGIIAEANGGVLFLDELAELAPPVQAKLLRALESGEYRPLGSTRTARSSFRLIVATNADIDRLVADNRLRSDLAYRLGGLRIVLPPLRDRIEDIPLLVEHFLKAYRLRDSASPRSVTQAAMKLLLGHSWPGNVRELRNVVEAAAALAAGAPCIDSPHLSELLGSGISSVEPPGKVQSMADAILRTKDRVIRAALVQTGGNRAVAAMLLGISPATLYRELARMTASANRALKRESPTTASTLNNETLSQPGEPHGMAGISF